MYSKCSYLPVFVQLPDGLLQGLLLRFRQDVGELVTGLQEAVEHALVQLAEELLQDPA